MVIYKSFINNKNKNNLELYLSNHVPGPFIRAFNTIPYIRLLHSTVYRVKNTDK